jgi:hypothetical protein
MAPGPPCEDAEFLRSPRGQSALPPCDSSSFIKHSDHGHPALNSFWKHRKSKKSRLPLPSQSA